MTESEAIERLKCLRLYMKINDRHSDSKFLDEDYEANAMAINALEKQIPKYPIFQFNLSDTTTIFNCQCGVKIKVHHDIGIMDNNDAPNYCKNCGQRIDFGE